MNTSLALASSAQRGDHGIVIRSAGGPACEGFGGEVGPEDWFDGGVSGTGVCGGAAWVARGRGGGSDKEGKMKRNLYNKK